MTKKILGFTLLMISFFVGAVHASTLTFDFSDDRQIADSIYFQEEDISVIATAQTYWLGAWHDSQVTQSHSGLGVRSGLLDSGQIDGLGPDEALILTFSEDVIINKAWFTLVGLNDDFSLSVDGNLLVEGDIPGNGLLDFGSLSDSDRTGNLFIFSVTGLNDDYKVARVEVGVVPIPGTAFLFLGGLIGIVGIRRKIELLRLHQVLGVK